MYTFEVQIMMQICSWRFTADDVWKWIIAGDLVVINAVSDALVHNYEHFNNGPICLFMMSDTEFLACTIFMVELDHIFFLGSSRINKIKIPKMIVSWDLVMNIFTFLTLLETGRVFNTPPPLPKISSKTLKMASKWPQISWFFLFLYDLSEKQFFFWWGPLKIAP